MADLVPVLIGTAGFVVGECYVLDNGVDIVVGRSRSCDISLRKATAYLNAPPKARDDDHDFNTVSRRHLRVQVKEATLHLQDLSTNGSFLNDEPINQGRDVDLSEGSYSLRLGTRESFRLTRLPQDDPRVIAQRSKPTQVDDDAKDD
jgi:pSer/pThr/pTyr-binding forkhead associated (FHA) protein